jgi:hypothetical protein
MGRSVTPPPASYLLTPPPTGGFDTRDDFGDTKFANIASKRLNKFKEGESPGAFFEDHQEGSDVELSGSEEIASPTSEPSSASSASDASIVPETNTIWKLDFSGILATTTDAPPVTDPFPLLDLPLSVRNRVYEHLLVVPGLLCIRQNQSSSQDENKAYIHAEPRQLLPGIAHAFTLLTVDGYKIPFSRFASTNINILLSSKEVFAEAKAVLYSKNNFGIVKPSPELTPAPDYSVRLFPPSCQRLVTKLTISIRSFYNLHWLLSTGKDAIKNFHRGIRTLTLMLELTSTKKGFARQWAKNEGEKWHVYVKRLQIEIAKDAFATDKGKKINKVPTWMNLQVLFSGESYDEKVKEFDSAVGQAPEQAKQHELRYALVEACELFKKGGR